MSFSCPTFVWLLVLLKAFCACTQNVTLYGPAFANAIFQDLRTSFSLSHAYIFKYDSISAQDPLSYLNLNQAVVVDTLANVPATSIVIPLFGFPLVIVFNLPSSSLMLTQQALVDIFLGRITMWNDTRLVNVSSNLTLPNEKITLVVGALLERVVEGMSVLAGTPLTTANMSSVNVIETGLQVCSRVKATPYSLGFSWMGDAIETSSHLAMLQNLEGNWVDPAHGAPIALSEFNSAKQDDPDVTPHNMPGRLSWPLMDILYVVLPQKMNTCDELIVLQHFLSLVLFQTDSMDSLVQVLGWEPAKSLEVLDSSLGALSDKVDYRDLLYGIACGTKEEVSQHKIGATPQLWPFVLKMLAPYTGEIDNTLELISTRYEIDTLLNATVLGKKAVVVSDMAFTWEPLVEPFLPKLISVPCFMGSTIVSVNLGNISITLSLPLIARIFSRNITFWNDTSIRTLNKDVPLPSNPIVVLASPLQELDGPTVLFASGLATAVPSFNWTAQVNPTVASEDDIIHLVQFTEYSIGYGFGHLVNDAKNVPQLIGFADKSVAFSYDSLFACWYSRTNESCWPLAVPLVVIAPRPTTDTVCKEQKISADFIAWIMKRAGGLDQYLPPNTLTESIGDVEFCNGRSMLVTRTEIQSITPSVMVAVHVLCAIGMFWAACQGIALAVARKKSELKSASVVFSLLAVIGVFLILLTPLLIVQNNLNLTKCGSALWFLVIGFSLVYGSLFAKLFRLYTIFTSRKLVVPRLSNKKLFWIVLAFLALDTVLLLIYNILTPPEPTIYSGYLDDPEDLVTGKRHLTLEMCNFHDSAVLIVLIISKLVIALCGAIMAYFIRQVDRRFTSSSALGWSFYNLFFTSLIGVVILVFFKPASDLESTLFIPVFCGLWIIFVTLVALTLDSNVLTACSDFSKPLRRMLNLSKDSKETKEKNVNVLETETAGHSRSSTVFVVNREMFPSKYSQFENELLEKILEELNFQRTAVRRAMGPSTATGTATVCTELPDLGPRGSTKIDTPTRFNSKSKSGFTSENSSKAASEAPRPYDPATLKVSIDAPEIDYPHKLAFETSDSQSSHIRDA